uniref:Uncharacterized protein n=1 Tax=Moschus moschiferus TaxID=68415 RepID=A0A8C6FSY3_MOSMO
MAEAGSTAVSGAGTPVAGPAGRDLFAKGLLEFLRPAVQQLDSHVHAIRETPDRYLRQDMEVELGINSVIHGFKGSLPTHSRYFTLSYKC